MSTPGPSTLLSFLLAIIFRFAAIVSFWGFMLSWLLSRSKIWPNEGISVQRWNPVFLNHADRKYPNIVLNSVYLAVIESRVCSKISFRTSLFPSNTNRVLGQVLLYDSAVLGFVGVLRGALIASVYNSMLVSLRKIRLQSCLSVIRVNRPRLLV